MPSTRPKPSSKPFHDSLRTALIVGLIISILGILVLAYLFYQRRLRRNVKAGARPGSIAHMAQLRNEGQGRDVEKGLETGVIQEPLPVYAKEPMRDEKVLEMSVRGGGT